MGTKHVTCRYFLHGVCREGSNCHFSHDVQNSAPSMICRYYQRGACAYGDRCRYDHVKVPPRGGGATDTMGGVATAYRPPAVAPPPVRVAPPPVRVAPPPARLAPPPAHVAPPPVAGSTAPPVFFSSVGSSSSSSSSSSYVEATKSGLSSAAPDSAPDSAQLCPYLVMGQCHYGDRCVYLHGDRCEVCGLHLLHPNDEEQRREHEKLCLSEFEAEMEKAFAAQISQDKVCSICMEVVVQKLSQSERRFGILSSCDHCFCLSCIRKWRHAPFSNDVIKACPECRVPSELVIPSVFWVQDPTQKEELVQLFKSSVGKKPCKFFLQGRGSCPFSDRCLYLHQDQFGRRPGPEPKRKQLGPEGSVRFMSNIRLWDFIEEREQRSAPPTNLYDDVTAPPTDEVTEQEEEVTSLSQSLQTLSTDT